MSQMPTEWNFRYDVREFLKATGMPQTSLGRYLYNDPRWYSDVISGQYEGGGSRKPSTKNLQKLWDYLIVKGYFNNKSQLPIYSPKPVRGECLEYYHPEHKKSML